MRESPIIFWVSKFISRSGANGGVKFIAKSPHVMITDQLDDFHNYVPPGRWVIA